MIIASAALTPPALTHARKRALNTPSSARGAMALIYALKIMSTACHAANSLVRMSAHHYTASGAMIAIHARRRALHASLALVLRDPLRAVLITMVSTANGAQLHLPAIRRVASAIPALSTPQEHSVASTLPSAAGAMTSTSALPLRGRRLALIVSQPLNKKIVKILLGANGVILAITARAKRIPSAGSRAVRCVIACASRYLTASGATRSIFARIVMKRVRIALPLSLRRIACSTRTSASGAI